MYARLFSQPLTTIAQSLSSIQQTSAASKRVFTLLEQEELIDESCKKAKLKESEIVEKIKNDIKEIDKKYMPVIIVEKQMYI